MKIWILLLTALAVARTSAQVIHTFDLPAEVSRWRWDFGNVDHEAEFDPAVDANNNAASGSMKVSLSFDSALGGGNQGAYTTDLPEPLDGAQFQRLHMDVLVDPSSAVASGSYGFFELVIRNGSGYSYNSQFGGNLSTNNPGTWRHIDVPVIGAVDAIRGITVKLYGGGALEGNTTMWLDNLLFTLPPATSAPPALVLEPATTGLEIASSGGSLYQRQDIRTAGTDYSWLAPFVGPVTYSFTLADFPIVGGNGFETRMMLVGNNAAPGQFADYNEANVVYFRVVDNPGGPGYIAELRYKSAAANSNIFDGPLVARLATPTVLGTWGITLDGTNALLFAPDGTTTNGAFGQDVLTAFQQSTAVYLGVLPNDTPNLGRSATFSGVSVTGANTPLVDNFTTLDGWVTSVAADPTGVLINPEGAIGKVTWPASATGFTLRSVSQLVSAPDWPLSSLTVRTVGSKYVAVFGTDTGNAFFRLQK